MRPGPHGRRREEVEVPGVVATLRASRAAVLSDIIEPRVEEIFASSQENRGTGLLEQLSAVRFSPRCGVARWMSEFAEDLGCPFVSAIPSASRHHAAGAGPQFATGVGS